LEKSIPFAVFLTKKFLNTGFVNIICGFSARYDGKTQLFNKNIKIIKRVFGLIFVDIEERWCYNICGRSSRAKLGSKGDT